MRGLLLLLLGLVTLIFVLPALIMLASPPETADRPSGWEVQLYVNDEGLLLTLPLETYIEGVVAAEMPASFHEEALKAQAVAARTYAVRRLRAFGGAGCPDHPAADLCSDPARDQAWKSPEQLRDDWGPIRYIPNRLRIARAVQQTAGEILTYQGRPIDAVYHSTSGGQTESAAAVWGESVPYLQSVPSEYEDHAPRHREVHAFTLTELTARLDTSPLAMRRHVRDGRTPVEVIDRTPSGRAAQVRVGGDVFSGVELRESLELPSTWFEVEIGSGRVQFATRGFGHGVGLSQYGADGLARAGADYRAILDHYYQGVELRRLADANLDTAAMDE